MSKETPGGQPSQLILALCAFMVFFYLFTTHFYNREYWLTSFLFLFLGLFSLVKYTKHTKEVISHEPKIPFEKPNLPEKTPTKEQKADQSMFTKPIQEEPIPLSTYSQLLSVPTTTQKGSFNPIYSPKLTKMKITDEKSLKKYMDVYQEEEAKSTAVAQQKISTIPFTPIPYKSGPIPKDIEVKKKSDENFKRIPFFQTIKKLNISYTIDDWSDKLRIWFSEMVAGPLIKALDKFEVVFGAPITRIAIPSKQMNTGVTKPESKNPHIWSSIPTNKTNSISSFQISQNTQQMSDEASGVFHSLDKYLSIDQTQKDELIARIKYLSKSSVLNEYSWDGKRNNKIQDYEIIPDAQILMHLFCSFLDEKITPSNSLASERPFTADHFAVFPLNLAPDQPISNVVIVQSHRNPPHYDLLINGKELWEIKEGPMNLFYCLVIFLFYFKKHYNGYIGNTWLGSPATQLLTVVS